MNNNNHEFKTYKLANLAEDLSAEVFEMGSYIRQLAKMLPEDYEYSIDDCRRMLAIKDYLVDIMHNIHYVAEEMDCMDVWEEINE